MAQISCGVTTEFLPNAQKLKRVTINIDPNTRRSDGTTTLFDPSVGIRCKATINLDPMGQSLNEFTIINDSDPQRRGGAIGFDLND